MLGPFFTQFVFFEKSPKMNVSFRVTGGVSHRVTGAVATPLKLGGGMTEPLKG